MGELSIEIYDATFGEDDFVDSFPFAGTLDEVDLELALRRYASEVGEDVFGSKPEEADLERAARDLAAKQEAWIDSFRLVVV